MNKFEKLVVGDKFQGIQIISIINIHTKKKFDNLYLYKGFQVSDGTGYPVHVQNLIVFIGHLSIETKSLDDATRLCELILDICL